MMKRLQVARPRAGFTLVEMIIVMVITGVLAGMVAVFIRAPVQSYVDSAARAELTDIADLALRRISREIRLALPNSVTVSANGGTLMFVSTKTGGRYVDVSNFTDPANPPNGVFPLDWSGAGNLNFHMVGAAPAGRQQILAGDRIVVFNLGPGMDPANFNTGGNVARVAAVAGTLVTLATNPFGVQNPQMPSPTFSFQVVNGTVGYQCDLGAGTLTRFDNPARPDNEIVPFNNIMPATPPGTPAVLARMVSACTFNYATLANTSAAVVSISLTLTHANGEHITLVRQVHVDNTP